MPLAELTHQYSSNNQFILIQIKIKKHCQDEEMYTYVERINAFLFSSKCQILKPQNQAGQPKQSSTYFSPL